LTTGLKHAQAKKAVLSEAVNKRGESLWPRLLPGQSVWSVVIGPALTLKN
jgi:hypothetical protein